MTFSVVSAALPQVVERALHRVGVAVRPPCLDVGDECVLHRGVDLEDRLLAVERRRRGLGEHVDADDLQLAVLDATDPLGVAPHQPALQLVDRLERAAAARARRRARPIAASTSSAVFASTTCRAVEEVVVLEQVGLEREHLLDAQRPLLIPRARQAERLVPRRQLDRPGPGVLRQRDAERLEHDALHVVLRLRLGEPEAVDLHAVAEPARLVVGDAVALEPDAIPQLGEGPHLAGLLDESDAGVDEEADRREHRREPIVVDLAGLAHRVEHADGGRERVGDLLHRRRARLLEVVAADVHRVPLRDPLRAERDHVDDQPPARQRREDVRAAATGTP